MIDRAARRLSSALLCLVLAACAAGAPSGEPAGPLPSAATALTAAPGDMGLDPQTLIAVGDDYFNSGNFAAAALAYDDAYQAAAHVVARNPGDRDAELGLGQSFDRLGRIAQINGDVAGARRNWEQMMAIADAGLAVAPTDPEWRRIKAFAHGRMALVAGPDALDEHLGEMSRLLTSLHAEGRLSPEERLALDVTNAALDGSDDDGVADPYLEIDKFDDDTPFAAGDYQGALRESSKRVIAASAFVLTGDLDAASVASEYGSQAWRALFAQEYMVAESSSRRGLEIDPSQVWIATNLAHALMFQDRIAEADAIYDAHRGAVLVEDQGLTWEAVVADDFAQLRAAGFVHPHMDEVLARFSPS